MALVLGLITVNSKDILEVDADPGAGGGTAASIGSLAMYDSGAAGFLYIKAGAADTAWTQVDTDANDWKLNGNTLGANTSIGSIDDFDQIFIRNNIELMRTVGSSAAVQGLLIGLNASLGGRLQLSPSAAGDDIFKEVLSPTSNPVIYVTRLFRSTTVSNASATFNVAIPTSYSAKLECNVIGRQTGGSAGTIGDMVSYQKTITAGNLAGTVSDFKQQNDYTYESAAAYAFNMAASGANIVGTIDGALNRNVSWGVRAELLMITT